MKKTNKLLSFILSGVMLATTAVCPVTAQEAEGIKMPIKYGISYDYDTDIGTATATITIVGGNFGVGHFGFAYDPELLTLVNNDGKEFDPERDFISDVIIGTDIDEEYTVITTEETNHVSDLIDTENGTILFAWYTNHRIDENGKDVGYIYASNGPKSVATVNFVFDVENKTEEQIEEIKEKFDSKDAFPNREGEISLPGGWTSIIESKGEGDVEIKEKNLENLPVTNEILTHKPSVNGLNATQEKIDDKIIIVSWTGDNSVDNCWVEIIDENGNTIHQQNVSDGGKIENTEFKFNVKYTVKVTPFSNLGNIGDTVATDVTLKKSSASAGAAAGGASLTYTVTYHAGEGTIPEGQKFKYTVNRNGYVGGSPAVIAPEGKIFAGWSVDGVTLISVEVYKITKDVTFKALYVEKEDETHRPFILGYPGGEVRADNALTRAEAAAIIARASANFDTTKTYNANFTDVPADHWAANYIAFVYESNIVTGYEDNTYHPSSNITRAEFATIMQRYLGIEFNEDATFTDVGKDHWAVAYIGACKSAGLINGYENGEFRPSNEITRAEAVKILNRAADRAPNPTAISSYVNEKGVPFEDLDSNKWYFYEIMEAAFPHLVSYYH